MNNIWDPLNQKYVDLIQNKNLLMQKLNLNQSFRYLETIFSIPTKSFTK